jgi:N-acetyl-gamma-glutamyl-phosphate reductase
MSYSVFIDGAAGTTGLEIADRLGGRGEFDLIILDDARRKDSAARKEALHLADFAILCLHDDAARSGQRWRKGPRCASSTPSTAHRVAPGWTYGFAEIVGRDVVAGADRGQPGCYPTGFIALIAPLVRAGCCLPTGPIRSMPFRDIRAAARR